MRQFELPKTYSRSNYLSSLPAQSCCLGSHAVGEIEISTDPEVIDAVIKSRESKQYPSRCQNDLWDNGLTEIGIVFEDEYLLVVRDAVIFKDGKIGSYIRVFERSALTGQAGVVILPIRDGLIYLNRIFRHATRQWELELPRGYRDGDCSLEEAVEIELLQEVGLEIESVIDLGEIQPNTGLFNGSAQAYLVNLLPGQAQAVPEEGESISETLALTLDEVNEKIVSGEIRDGFTLSALYLAQVRNLEYQLKAGWRGVSLSLPHLSCRLEQQKFCGSVHSLTSRPLPSHCQGQGSK